MKMEITLERSEISTAICEYMERKGYSVSSIHYNLKQGYYKAEGLESVKMTVEYKGEKK